MNHTAYATATLTSPKGRRMVNNTQGTNTTHAEALLSFDPTDTGDYLEASTHTVYCPCMGYFIHNVPSQASVPVPTFNVAYSSYIPVDHVSGPTGCSVGLHTVLFMIYMGDALRNTYRTTESIQITPDGQNSSGFFQNTGNTRNYGYGSPANGSTLSQADKDGVGLDCYLWNNAGQAVPAFSHDVSYPYAFEGQVHYSGAASNPLETQVASITWDMRTVVDTTNPSAPTAYVNYNHTCYPAHQIKVNGTVVYSYTPSENDLAYITGCLTQVLSKITGQTSSVQVPSH